jgi:hypothetical protein
MQIQQILAGFVTFFFFKFSHLVMYGLSFLDAPCLDLLYCIVYPETTSQIVDSRIY